MNPKALTVIVVTIVHCLVNVFNVRIDLIMMCTCVLNLFNIIHINGLNFVFLDSVHLGLSLLNE